MRDTGKTSEGSLGVPPGWGTMGEEMNGDHYLNSLGHGMHHFAALWVLLAEVDLGHMFFPELWTRLGSLSQTSDYFRGRESRRLRGGLEQR